MGKLTKPQQSLVYAVTIIMNVGFLVCVAGGANEIYVNLVHPQGKPVIAHIRYALIWIVLLALNQAYYLTWVKLFDVQEHPLGPTKWRITGWVVVALIVQLWCYHAVHLTLRGEWPNPIVQFEKAK